MIIIYICGCLAVQPVAVAAEEPPAVQYVFLILVDGLNTEGYRNSPAPNIRFLANEGILDEQSVTLPADTVEEGVATLLTGTFPEEHKHYTMNDKVEVESLLDVLKKYGKSSAVIDGSGGKLQSFARGDNSYIQLDAKSTDKQVFDQAIDHFYNYKPYFTAIYTNDCLEGLVSVDKQAYYQATIAFDRSLGSFLDGLRKQELLDKSLIVLTSPRSSSVNRTCPLIMRGPTCKPATRVQHTMGIDVGPTLSRLTGMPKPFNAKGTPLYDVLNLKGEEEFLTLRQWVKELKEQRLNTWNKYLDLQDKLNRTIHQMTAIKEEKQSIFDFAGEREQAIGQLRGQIVRERLIFLGIMLLMGLGYLVEFKLLKRKFLLFR
jgi:arylsulfatase A-like enzyme